MWIDDLNKTTGGGFDPDATASEGPKSMRRKTQGIVPMFIRHLYLLPSEDMNFFGHKIQMVKIYGLVKTQSITSTKVVYEIEDFTGQIECHFWLDQQAGFEPEIPKVTVNSYYCVMGTLKSLSEGRRILILSIKPVEKFNELLLHYQACIYARYDIEETTRLNYDAAVMEVADSTFPGEGFNGNSIGTALQNNIYKVISSNTNQNGVHISEIQNAVQCDRKDLVAALDYLVNEGHVYTTIDDDYFKATDA